MALWCGSMPTETATIRVTRETRDRLAEEASRRHLSLSAMLAEFAARLERSAILRTEREASRSDAKSPRVRAEDEEWERVLGDGIH